MFEVLLLGVVINRYNWGRVDFDIVSGLSSILLKDFVRLEFCEGSLGLMKIVYAFELWLSYRFFRLKFCYYDKKKVGFCVGDCGEVVEEWGRGRVRNSIVVGRNYVVLVVCCWVKY